MIEGENLLQKVEKKAVDASLLGGMKINNTILTERIKHGEKVSQQKSEIRKMKLWTSAVLAGTSR